MFSVGDKVVHPLHGAGVIEAITQERIAEKTTSYYVFQMPSGRLTLKIPTENCSSIGVRHLVSMDRMKALFERLPQMETEMSDNWNRRYRENMEKLKSGDLDKVAGVIKSLSLREAQRGLSTGERKMLHSAKQVLLSEVVLVFQMTYEAAESLLHRTIMEN